MAIAVGLSTAASTAISGIEEASVRALVKLHHVLPAADDPRQRVDRERS